MDDKLLRRLLEEVQDGRLDVEAALQNLRKLPFDDLGYAKIDYHRSIRQGVPEVIFCQGKVSGKFRELSSRWLKVIAISWPAGLTHMFSREFKKLSKNAATTR